MPLLDHLRKHIAEPRYARLLINIAHRVIDIYAAVVSQSVVIEPAESAAFCCATLSSKASHQAPDPGC